MAAKDSVELSRTNTDSPSQGSRPLDDLRRINAAGDLIAGDLLDILNVFDSIGRATPGGDIGIGAGIDEGLAQHHAASALRGRS